METQDLWSQNYTHTRRAVQLPIARARSLGQIHQNIKEMRELLLHVFRV